jgi:hypothetical protein
VSKSEAIRQFFKSNPNATNSEVVEGLAQDGIEVNANLVNQVRHDYKHKRTEVVISPILSEDALLRVKTVADEVGGIDRLIQLANFLKKLTGGENNGSQKLKLNG